MKVFRKIIEIDEGLCDGCGLCVMDCAENAIAIVDGKAKVISDNLCDGLGACLQACPQNALRIVEREALPFDEAAVQTTQAPAATAPPASSASPASPACEEHPSGCATCPGASAQLFPMRLAAALPGTAPQAHWPVKLRLLPPTAPFLHGAHILLTADCAPVACRNFHDLAQGKIVLLACPKFEDQQAIAHKLSAILNMQEVTSLHVMRMEVPCCQGLSRTVAEVFATTPKAPPLHTMVMNRAGMALSGV